VTHTPGGRELRIAGWGYWDAETCQAFARHVGAALDKLTPPIALLFDASVLKPQALEGQEVIRAFFRRTASMPRSSVSVLATNVLTRMQLTRLSRECSLEIGFSDQPMSTPPLRGP
jgi:hypothetical protein